jgi:hypothetical protein
LFFSSAELIEQKTEGEEELSEDDPNMEACFKSFDKDE